MKKALVLCLATAASVVCKAPGVNLGYAVHLPTYHKDGDYYSYDGIRYAEQPVGRFRFKKPVEPQTTDRNLKEGSDNTKCLQAYPRWYVDSKVRTTGGDPAVELHNLNNAPNQTESCLVLDVHVPARESRSNWKKKGLDGAPVIVWFHGGGFTHGHKQDSGGDAELLRQSTLDDGEGVIIVRPNYRLGMMGYLGAPGIPANLGLFDQAMALDWVYKYIHRFQGNPKQVTIMGEGAGAASVLHMITTKSNLVSSPLQNAIVQSPSSEVYINTTRNMEEVLNGWGKEMGQYPPPVSLTSLWTKADLMGEKATEVLKKVNQGAVMNAAFGHYNFGPARDGWYVVAPPQVLLGDYEPHKPIGVMAIHHAGDGLPPYAPPGLKTSKDLRQALARVQAQATPATIDAWMDVYPDVLDGTHPWRSQTERYRHMTYDLNGACSTAYLGAVYRNHSRNAIFNWPYRDADGIVPRDAPNALGDTLRDWILNFVRYDDPNISGAFFEFPRFGDKATIVNVTKHDINLGTDNKRSKQCDWVVQALKKKLF